MKSSMKYCVRNYLVAISDVCIFLHKIIAAANDVVPSHRDGTFTEELVVNTMADLFQTSPMASLQHEVYMESVVEEGSSNPFFSTAELVTIHLRDMTSMNEHDLLMQELCMLANLCNSYSLTIHSQTSVRSTAFLCRSLLLLLFICYENYDCFTNSFCLFII